MNRLRQKIYNRKDQIHISILGKNFCRKKNFYSSKELRRWVRQLELDLPEQTAFITKKVMPGIYKKLLPERYIIIEATVYFNNRKSARRFYVLKDFKWWALSIEPQLLLGERSLKEVEYGN
jgi:hypothetical protein